MTRFKIARAHLDLPPCFCIGPRSFQADRTVAATDTILAPSRHAPKHEWCFEVTKRITRPTIMGRKAKVVAALTGSDTITLPDQIVMDCRFYAPDNFAHFLCFHTPLLAAVAREMQIDMHDIKVILPKNTPEYIRGMVEILGLDVLRTDQPVSGQIITFTTSITDEFRGFRRTILETAQIPQRISTLTAASPNTFLGKYFIARRGNRALENNDMVSEHLSSLGYQTVYMEDFALIDQFKLMQSAQSLIAIHGAGLASFLYLSRPEQLDALVEIMPVGLTSTFFREMADAMGVYYIAVRGKLKRAYVPAIYDAQGSYMAHQNDTFEVDIASLDQALAFAERKCTVPTDLYF